MACPKCASEEWKLASVIHAGGISTISTSTIGVGGGANADIFGGGVGLGAGVGSTSGKQQTELSRLAAPPLKEMRPAKVSAILGVLFWVIAFVLLAVFSKSRTPELIELIIVAGFSGGFFLWIGGLIRLNMTPDITKALDEKHKLALFEYEKKRMCLRCGALYLEDDKPNVIGSKTLAPTESRRLASTTKKCPFCAETILAEAVLCKHCHSKIQ